MQPGAALSWPLPFRLTRHKTQAVARDGCSCWSRRACVSCTVASFTVMTMLLKFNASSGFPLRMEESASPPSTASSALKSARQSAGFTGAALVSSTHVYLRIAGQSSVAPLLQYNRSQHVQDW